MPPPSVGEDRANSVDARALPPGLISDEKWNPRSWRALSLVVEYALRSLGDSALR